MEKTLEELLKVHNVRKVEKFEELEKVFDLKLLDEDNTPAIVTDHKVVVLFDNMDFNETYLIDVVNKYLDEHASVANNVEILYVDDFNIRRKLLAPGIFINLGALGKENLDEENLDKENIDGMKAFEKTYLPTTIFTINPITNEFRRYSETFVPFDEFSINKFFTESKLEE
jgi:hypothetical protein